MATSCADVEMDDITWSCAFVSTLVSSVIVDVVALVQRVDLGVEISQPPATTDDGNSLAIQGLAEQNQPGRARQLRQTSLLFEDLSRHVGRDLAALRDTAGRGQEAADRCRGCRQGSEFSEVTLKDWKPILKLMILTLKFFILDNFWKFVLFWN